MVSGHTRGCEASTLADGGQHTVATRHVDLLGDSAYSTVNKSALMTTTRNLVSSKADPTTATLRLVPIHAWLIDLSHQRSRLVAGSKILSLWGDSGTGTVTSGPKAAHTIRWNDPCLRCSRALSEEQRQNVHPDLTSPNAIELPAAHSEDLRHEPGSLANVQQVADSTT